MKKEDILREELNRMRKLMGMSGQLYQKPIMEDESKHHGDAQPNPADYKGGESNPQFRLDFEHWSEHHQDARPPAPRPPAPRPPASPPSSPPSPPPAAPKNLSSKAKNKTGTGARSALDSGEFVVPISQRSGKGKRARNQNRRIRGKGRIKQSKTSNVKKTKGRKKKKD